MKDQEIKMTLDQFFADEGTRARATIALRSHGGIILYLTGMHWYEDESCVHIKLKGYGDTIAEALEDLEKRLNEEIGR